MGGCPNNPGAVSPQIQPIIGSIIFQRLIQIISYVCVALTVCLWLGLALPHLRRYRAPDEQRPIFRIISCPLVFCAIALGAVHAYHIADYLEPIANLYEAYCLASLFLLYVHYVVPEAHNREEFFRSVEMKSKSGKAVPEGSLRWFRRVWRIVFFFVLIYTLLIIIEEITLATADSCATVKSGRHGRLIITVLQFVAMAWALLAILRFQRRLSKYMEGRRAMPKLITFKLLVVVNVVQHFAFNILSTQVHGGSKITYRDIATGIPSLLTSIESVIFIIGFYFTFHSKEYKEGKGNQPTSFKSIYALLHALNPIDLIHGVAIAFTSFKKRKVVGGEPGPTVHHGKPKQPELVSAVHIG